jgi:hypothetical protein
MSENQIQKQIIDYLTVLENQGKIYFFRSGSGAIKTERGGFFKTGKTGCPDISLITKDGQYVGIEVKSAKGKLSEAQMQTANRLSLLGAKYIVVRSVTDLISDLKILEIIE